VESALRFLKNGGKEVIITSYMHICDAVEGKAGTLIVPCATVNEKHRPMLVMAGGGR
jgi:hypothetical protein